MLGIRRVDRMQNARVRDLCGVKRMEERINGKRFRWFDHTEIRENSRLQKGYTRRGRI